MQLDFLQILSGVFLLLSILLLSSSILQFVYGNKKNLALAFLCLIIAIGFLKNILWQYFYNNALFLIFIGGIKEVFIGPLLFFHVKMKRTKLYNKEVFLHFALPIIIYSAYIIKVLFFYNSSSLFNTQFYFFLTILLFFHYILYFILSYKEYLKISTLVISKVSKTVFLFLIIYILPNFLLILSTLLLMISYNLLPNNVFMKDIIIGVWVKNFGAFITRPLAVISNLFIIGYAFIEIPFFKSLFYPKNILHNQGAINSISELKSKIDLYFNELKKFKNKTLTIDKCSEDLEITKKELIDYFKVSEKVTFNEFVNTYRVNEFKSLLSNSDNNIYDINSLSEMAGFKSRSTFYRVFKDIEGITPTQYKSLLQN